MRQTTRLVKIPQPDQPCQNRKETNGHPSLLTLGRFLRTFPETVELCAALKKTLSEWIGKMVLAGSTKFRHSES